MLRRSDLFHEYLKLQYNALIQSHGERASLIELINQKEVVGDRFNQLRLALQRRTKGRPAQVSFLLEVILLLIESRENCGEDTSRLKRMKRLSNVVVHIS